MTTIEFRSRDPATGATDGDLYNVLIRDAFQRFASGATADYIDRNGTKIDDYPYGQRIELQVSDDNGSTWSTRQAGVALSAEQTTRDGLPKVEVPVVGYTHFLTRNSIEKDYTDQSKSTILQDVVQTFTPVTWNASKVSVQNDSAIDLSVRGSRPDEVIDRVASNSADEEWFVDQSFEFIFQQQDTERAAEVNDSNVIDYDLPREGERAVNEFTVYYGQNLDSAWIEDDKEAQQDLQDKLNTSSGVVIADADAFPEVSNESEAEKLAINRLGSQSVVQTGTITTPLGFFDTAAGDVFALTIDDANINDTDFRAAQIDYDWLSGTSERVVAENTGADIDELLVALSDSLANDRLRNADPAASVVRALRLQSGVTVSLSATITAKTAGGGFVLGQSQLGQGTNDTLGGSVSATATKTVASKRATVTLLNLLRDVWQEGNSAFVDLTHVAVGTDDTAATRADSSLQAEADRVAVEKFGAGNASERLEFVATVPAGGAVADGAALKELSVTDAASGGNHYLRLTYAGADLDASTRLKIHVEATIDVDTEQQGVITTTGQERLVDLVTGESGHEPTDMVYGNGTAAATESDTALGTPAHEDTIDFTSDGAPGVAKIVERVLPADADTTNFSESGLENAANELLQRVTWDAYGEDVELKHELKMKASNA